MNKTILVEELWLLPPERQKLGSFQRNCTLPKASYSTTSTAFCRSFRHKALKATEIRWPFLIGLLADTHIPYRAKHLPQHVINAMQGVDLILHAGDVDEPWALEPLRDIAPVYAVRGNYHWLDGSAAGPTLPLSVELRIADFHIALTHGHLTGPTAIFWRMYAILHNMLGRWHMPAYDKAIAQALLRRFPQANVIVFGHTHYAYNVWWENTLLINPGAALETAYFNAPYHASVAHLELYPNRSPKVTLIDLRY